MTKFSKIIVSLPSVVGLVLIVIVLFPSFSFWLFPSLAIYNLVLVCFLVLSFFQIAYLIVCLWRIKTMERKVKINWTLLLIVYSSISCLIFIWNKLDVFEGGNESN